MLALLTRGVGTPIVARWGNKASEALWLAESTSLLPAALGLRGSFLPPYLSASLDLACNRRAVLAEELYSQSFLID